MLVIFFAVFHIHNTPGLVFMQKRKVAHVSILINISSPIILYFALILSKAILNNNYGKFRYKTMERRLSFTISATEFS